MTMKNLEILVVASILALILILSIHTVFIPPMREREKPMEKQPPSPPVTQLTTSSIYGYSIFTYNGSERIVAEVHAPTYSLPLDPGSIENIELFVISREALEKLLKNGFVVIPGEEIDIAEYYKDAINSGYPVFITTDSVLFIYHAFFETVLMELEEKQFIPRLKKLLLGLVREAEKIYGELSEGTLAKEATRLDIAYLSVALKLIEPGYNTPSYIQELVEKELELIESASSSQAPSPIFGYKEDYTQYKPRGHYTESDELRRYFRCMMWLGRMRFEVQDPENPELSEIQTAQALILTYLIAATEIDGVKAINLWEEIYLPISFIVGKSDDLTFYDYIRVMGKVYGDFTPGQVDDRNLLEKFMEEIVELDKSRIISSPIFPYEKPRLTGLRFMGQRFILDGYIHQQLCYPNLPTRTQVRGLDIMAVMDSDRAMEHLKDELQKYEGLGEKILKLRAELSKLETRNWTETLYMGWLYTIKALLTKPGQGYPAFMQTNAWLDKSLNTALASWAQLRHDTILYAKQPYAVLTAVPQKPPHPGYVEPNPLLYSRLRNLVEATKNGLEKLGLLDENMRDRLGLFSSILNKLVDISEKELKGTPLSGEDQALIEQYGFLLEKLLTVTEKRVKDPRIIADVFTDPNTGTVLEVGTGYFDRIIVVYKTLDGKLYASTGLTMSYYEFYWPQNNRLTDEEWRQMLEASKQPEQLEWIYNFKSKE